MLHQTSTDPDAGTRGQCYKTFFFVTHKSPNIATLLVPSRPCLLSIMFVGKAWAQCYKTFLSVTYEFSYQARVFVPGKLFQQGLTNTLA
jgi:hypothetical protein